jgi:hypothetical protein
MVDEERVYEQPYVRFDWRNSNQHAEGDVAMCESLANRLLDVEKARALALRAFDVLRTALVGAQIELWDICFFITADGSKLFGEITQDNARYKKLSSGAVSEFSHVKDRVDLDKDAWRSGNSGDDVLAKWTCLRQLTETVDPCLAFELPVATTLQQGQ